jgi:hypothetical protein
MLKVARPMKERSSMKRSALNSRALGFCLPRPWRFRAQSPEVPESGSLEPHRQENPEVSGKCPEVPGFVRTEPRRKVRFNTNMLPRHLTLVCRSKTIQSCLKGTYLSTRIRLMHLEIYLLAMC